MRELNLLLIGLLVAISASAASVLWLSSVAAGHTEAIYSASRFDVALACDQAKAEMITLGSTYDRFLLVGSARARKSLHIASEIMQGRLASLRAGAWVKLIVDYPQLGPLVAEVTASAADIAKGLSEPKLPPDEMHRLLEGGRSVLERLCTQMHGLDTGRVEAVRKELQSTNRKTTWLVVGFLLTVGGFASLIFRQNLLTRTSYRKQAELLNDFEILATTDRLTGLPNRARLLSSLDAAIEQLANGCKIGLITLDLDRFKLINDTLGHMVGDQLLKSVASRLERCVAGEPSSFVARLGGDEFIVAVLAECDVETRTMLIADTIIETLAEPHNIGGHTVWVAATVGIAYAPKHTEDRDELIRASDVALYKGKTKSRGTWHVYTSEMDETLISRQQLELEMAHAVEHGEFFLQYQPIVSVKTGQIETVEALMRWRHPTRGLVPPLDFIPIAEETGLIVDLAKAMLLQACRDACSMPETWSLAFNLSAVQFARGNLYASVVQALQESGLPARRLELEVTESTLIANDDKVLGTMNQLKMLGIRIALDDFGTGYSSLSYLRRFKFDNLKIDRSFMHGIPKNEQVEDVVRAITGLGAALDMTVTAEGIETREQFAALHDLGCHQAQGYVISRPKDLDELLGEYQKIQGNLRGFAATKERRAAVLLQY